jgi:UDP-N-acetylmuramate--alanine ligase
MENVKAAFVEYVKLLPDDGILVYNADDENCRGLSAHTKAKCISFSTKTNKANFTAKNISYDANGCASFDVYKNNAFYKTFKLGVPGEHNVYDALACIAVCSQFDIDKNSVKDTLKVYGGAERRFQYLGEVNGAKVYDDYGHHPTEILAVANAVKKRKYNHSWVLFQPHTFSRTKALLDDFASVLTNFDNIIVTDIYAAREIDNHEVSARDIIDKIEALGRKAYYIKDLESIVDFVRRNAKEDDIIIAQGAGTITQVGHELVQDPTSTPVSNNDCCGACAPVEETQQEAPVETVQPSYETSEPVVESSNYATESQPVEETTESVETQSETPTENNYNNNYHGHHNHYNNYNHNHNHNHDNNKFGNRFNH